MLIIPAVDPPSLRTDDGIDRRLAAVEFPRNLRTVVPPHERRELGECPECRDAMVTLSIMRAARVGESGWHPTDGTPDTKESLIGQIDPVRALIETLTDDDEGRTLDYLHEDFQQATGNGKLNKEWVARRINSYQDGTGKHPWLFKTEREWYTDQPGERNQRRVNRLQRREDRPMEDDANPRVTGVTGTNHEFAISPSTRVEQETHISEILPVTPVTQPALTPDQKRWLRAHDMGDADQACPHCGHSGDRSMGCPSCYPELIDSYTRGDREEDREEDRSPPTPKQEDQIPLDMHVPAAPPPFPYH